MMMILASLPFSKILISIGQFMMAGGWIVFWFDENEWLGRMRGKPIGHILLIALPSAFSLGLQGIGKGFRCFFRNKAALLFASIYLLHLAGLLWTTDFSYGIKDLRTKIPLLLMPLFLSTSEPFGKKAFYRFMYLFILAVLVRSVFNAWMITTHHLIDIRYASHNVSHIIFSLEIVLCLFSLLFFIFKRDYFRFWEKGILLLVLGWLLIYIILSQSFTGFAITLITALVLIPVLIFKTGNLKLKVVLITAILILTGGVAIFLRSIIVDYYHVNPVDFTKLEKTTSRGNPYINNIYATQTENGNYIWIYIQWDELRAAWNKRSRIPFDSLNLKSEPVAYTAVRYLTSKGWRKDADGVEKLKPDEIRAIEQGVANHIFLKEFSIRGRIYEFLWGFENYRETGNPSGATIMQRLEHWKASIGIIKDYWLTGVGTGDMNLAFKVQYEKMHTKLAPEQRWRSHNQFLSIFIGFGLFGFLWFVLSVFYPPVLLRRYDDYFFLVFLIIAVASMMAGDTIESQTGVSFFAVFYVLFLFARKEKDPIMLNHLKQE
jgi:hypothetical protein